MTSTRRILRANLALACLAYMADDWRKGLRLRRGRLETRSGTPHARFSLEQSRGYIERVYHEYLAYAGVERFPGKVAEIGPGDSFGVALLLLADGAEEVHTLDRYRPIRDPEQQRTIYRALAERHDMARLFDGELDEDSIRGLQRHLGQPAETFFAERPVTFDAILSRAVMEHLYDPLAALADMAAALKPGGRIVHRIDLRDHGMFAGRHPLTFLTIPERPYRRMTRNSGRPNRVLLPDYRAWLAGSGLTGDLTVTRLAGIEAEIVPPTAWDSIDPALRRRACDAVARVRNRLARRFRHLPDQDLAVSGIVLTARRPT